MNELGRNMRSRKRNIEDVGEYLLQHIQSLLPVEEAARTSVLSKSWLQAWSTIPTLRFFVGGGNELKLADVDRTLKRYLRDKIPIESFELQIDVENEESASLAQECIRSLATKTCVKEFTLNTILSASFTLPDEILGCKTLTTIRVSSSHGTHNCWMKATSHHQPMIINCVSLRQLYLEDVYLSQEVFDGILSSCSLLMKIELMYCEANMDLKTIKVKNLPYLSELTILLEGDSRAWEISHLPNLRFFMCNPFNADSISLRGSRVTELSLGGLITDDQSLDMIKLGFPFLEILTLDLCDWKLPSFRFTCHTLKGLSLSVKLFSQRLIDIQVYAPKLIYFCFNGHTMPSVSFPVSTLNQTTFRLHLFLPVGASFFLKMRETLSLSTKCDLHITTYDNNRQMPIHDLKTSLLLPPANNVEQLSFQAVQDECMWEHSPFFDAFFMICHPKYVFAKSDAILEHTNHFCKLILLEKKKKTTDWSRCLKYVHILSDPDDQVWVNLTSSIATSLLDESLCFDDLFKLDWY